MHAARSPRRAMKASYASNSFLTSARCFAAAADLTMVGRLDPRSPSGSAFRVADIVAEHSR